MRNIPFNFQCFAVAFSIMTVFPPQAVQAASMTSHYAGGQSFKGKVPTHITQSDTSDFSVKKKDYKHLEDQNETTIGDAGLKASKDEEHEYGKILEESKKKQINAMTEHNINPDDAMFQRSLAIENAPLKEFGGTSVRRKKTITKETKETCEEGVQFEIDIIRQLNFIPPDRQNLNTTLTLYYPDYLYNVGIQNDVMARLPVGLRDHQVDIERFRKFGCPHFKPVDAKTGKKYKIDCKRIKNFHVVNVSDTSRGYRSVDRFGNPMNPIKHVVINYKHDTYQSSEGGKEYWSSLTPENEKFIDDNHCHETKRACLDKGDKHFDELVVNKPCWKEQVTLQCKTEPQNGCRYLMKKGCHHESSTCLEKFQGICLTWKKEFLCKTSETVDVDEISAPMFCMSGDCFTPELKDNTGMNEAVAYLQLFKEMQADIANESVTIFKGENNQCAKHLVNFTNCCSSMSGWGTSVGLSKCSGEEKALAQKREKKLCHYVGTHCADKVLGVCTRKKSSYCCFPSKIGRIFQEQGRGQIGKSWGTSKNPQCEGFTREEMMRLDFSKMNLQEMVQDFIGKADITSQKQIPRQMVNTMPKMQTALKDKPGGKHEF